MGRAMLFSIAVIGLATAIAVAASAPPSSPPPLMGKADQADRVLIEKAARRMTLYRRGEALKGYEIQLNQSESDIYAAELETKFAKLEMEKYLGVDVTREVSHCCHPKPEQKSS